MKRIFFIFIVAISMALMALSNECISQVIDQQEIELSTMFIQGNSKLSMGFPRCREVKHGKCHCPRGPTGPQGPTGNTGPTGLPGPNTIVGSRIYGSFFTTANQVLNNQDPILFNTHPPSPLEANHGVSLNSSGSAVVITQPGDYLVIFGVSSNQLAVYALTLNGLPFVAGSNVDSQKVNQMTTVTTTVSILPVSVPASLSVINFSGTTFSLSSATPGDITAFIVVKGVSL